MNLDHTLARAQIEAAEEWGKWGCEIPALSFDPGWKVRVIPPFAGAIARFRVIDGEAEVSIYFDAYDRCGYCGEPYWEIYPHNDDTFRCLMNETDELIAAIRESIAQQKAQA